MIIRITQILVVLLVIHIQNSESTEADVTISLTKRETATPGQSPATSPSLDLTANKGTALPEGKKAMQRCCVKRRKVSLRNRRKRADKITSVQLKELRSRTRKRQAKKQALEQKVALRCGPERNARQQQHLRDLMMIFAELLNEALKGC
ncbi:uncharacterized protein LOC132205833 [Neocloeon triangulifer]|uniref:uncharacterized protein LOC132205833 n=1 Tax=Neocloeon triangulifer TaxID=2078957 RepID=UPI00286EF21E|nr:uncharacterized protein LOC132205833 [Neocloeon triangulifer]